MVDSGGRPGLSSAGAHTRASHRKGLPLPVWVQTWAGFRLEKYLGVG